MQTEQEFGIIKNLRMDIRGTPRYQVEMGEEGLIDILVEFNKIIFYLDEPILGKITFNEVKVKLRGTRIILYKKENYNLGKYNYFQSKNYFRGRREY